MNDKENSSVPKEVIKETHLNMVYPFRKEEEHKEKFEKVKKKLDIVGLISFFNVLSPEQINKISAKIKLRRYDKDSMLFHEGDVSDNLYIIKSGEVSLYKTLDRVEEDIKDVVILTKGDMFGEMGIITETPRFLSAKIISEKAELYVISRDDFMYMFRKNGELSLNLARILCERIDEATRRLVDYTKDYYTYLEEKSLNIRSKSEIFGMLPFFNDLSDEDINKISRKIKLRKYGRGTILFNEGDVSKECYIIKTGGVCLYRVFNKRMRDIREFFNLGKGNMFGERGIILEKPRAFSAKITSLRAEMYVLSKGDFLDMINHYPELSLNLVKVLCNRIEETNKRYFAILAN